MSGTILQKVAVINYFSGTFFTGLSEKFLLFQVLVSSSKIRSS